MKKTLLLLLLLSLFALLLAACSPKASEPLRIVVPPNPNAMPLFVVLADNPDLNLEVIPVPGVPELTAAMQGKKADVVLFFSAAGAKLYIKDALPNLRLWNVNVWRALYLVTTPEISSLEDLQGKKILASFQGGAPDLVMRAAMRQAGFDPDADFQLEYLPSAQVSQLLLAGKGEAALQPEPQITQLVGKAKNQSMSLNASIDLQADFGSASWENGQAPLGGIFVLQSVLDDPARRALFEEFAAAYDTAAANIMQDPAATAPVIAQGYADYFGATLSPNAIQKALENETLLFGSRDTSELRPDLDDFFTQIIGSTPNDNFYAR